MTTATHTTPRALTAYLRRATWGLPEARRQELWDELEEHVLTRADHLILTGLTPTQATAQAIRELGPPAHVTLGMAKVYTMPKLILAAGTLALALSAGLYALAGGAGPAGALPVLLSAPVKPTCVRGTVPPGVDIVSARGGVTCFYYSSSSSSREGRGVYLNGQDFVRIVQSQGGQATLSGRTLTVRLPGANTGENRFSARFVQSGQAYFDATLLIQMLSTSRPALFRGFDRPTVKIGGLSLQMGADQPVGSLWYNPLTALFVSALKEPPGPAAHTSGRYDTSVGYIVKDTSTIRHEVSTRLPPGEVVMLVTRRSGGNYTADTAEVQASGRVTLNSGSASVRFVASLSDLSPYDSGGRRNALLVRVTGIPLSDLKSGVFVPAQATSDAR